MDLRVIDPQDPRRSVFASNEMRTSKYTLLNFFPVALYLAFRLSTNFYFLIIAILQSWSKVSPVGPMTAVTPLVLVVGIVLLREAIEDHNRHVLDLKTNTKSIQVLRYGEILSVLWQDIRVGDIIQIFDKEAFPADGLLLSTSEDNGACLIDTSNLDGEANLKTRVALNATAAIKFETKQPAFQVKCEPPNVDLYKFTGTLSIASAVFALDEQQLLPRGSTLRNTKHIVLLVVYTGHETKMMLNAKKPYHKFSHVDSIMNQIVIFIFVFQVLLCILGSIYHNAWTSNSAFESLFVNPLGFESDSDLVAGIITFLSFVVLLNTFIPSSLVVSVELVKAIHAKFIGWDLQMQLPNGECAVANTPALMEELGQVKYLFSDKTGTLTENRMEFRKCSVAGHVYAYVPAPPPSAKEFKLSPSLAPTVSEHTLQQGTSAASILAAVGVPKVRSLTELQKAGVHLGTPEATFIQAMALCHTVMCEKPAVDAPPDALVQYVADSPDEGALVRAARDLGLAFAGRTNRTMTLTATKSPPGGPTLPFELLHVLAFNSTRKRMSVIVQGSDGKIELICKGADCTILELCNDFGSQSKDCILEHLKQFAIEGLRTLCFAKRELTPVEYESWQQRYQTAELLLQGREASMEALVCEIEQKMTYLASTAIEDKLQDGVPETVTRLLRAGIKIWVLTGDKVETAVEIGRSCRVIAKDMVEVFLQGNTVSELAKNLAALRAPVSKASGTESPRQALVIDGFSLSFALMPQNRKQFLQFTLECAAVIVCRMSPLQKALVVELVKESVPGITMAVGDGANDVSMIRAAHVGVGVSGQEGHQAVRSADFAIQQFRHLDRLLLFHGRLSYYRVTQCINYFFYKNVIFTAPQFIYGIYSLFSGTTYYSGLYIQAFNMLYTAAPVVARALMEKRLPDSLSVQFPELYYSGNNNARLLFSLPRTGLICIIGIIHAIVVTTFPLVFLDQTNGMPYMDLYCDGITAYISIIIIVTMLIFLETCNWTGWVVFSYVGSFAFFVGSCLIYDGMLSELYGDWARLFAAPTFWLTVVLTVAVCVLPILANQGYRENFLEHADPVHVLRRAKLFAKVMDSHRSLKQPGPTSAVGE
ncbi:P-type ATPase (P-ATPase) Superfamily [Achlya hypogyna]|uniref:Phospholipid-transporting ATPase n=1 Tax=Achlya hypogyna TaxID=1202772 RepID=A0A1V9YCN1_ACHHY|nr:P-type ATPase (P-ATPase) Superfamily [Achlya hypogyna]